MRPEVSFISRLARGWIVVLLSPPVVGFDPASGRSRDAYLSRDSAWSAEADRQRKDILEGIRPHLAAESSEAVERFTIGEGTTGLSGEAYYVG